MHCRRVLGDEDPVVTAVVTTCQAHAAADFTNLLVTKEGDGIIVLNPHLANCCVLRLEERAATSLRGILGEWLGAPR